MKTKLILLLLFWAGVVWGQKKISEIKPDKFPDLQESKTIAGFIINLNKNKNSIELEELIKSNTKLLLSDIDKNVVSEDTLVYETIYSKNGRPIINDILKAKVFVIKGNSDKKLYYYPNGGFFLDDVVKNEKYDRNEITKYELIDAYDNLDYDCNNNQAVHDSVLDSNLRIIKRAVVFNSSDEATNNNALAFTNGTNDTKISIGANFNYREKWFLNITVQTAAANTGLLYSKQSWKNDVGASFTLNRVIGKETQFFNTKECSKLYIEREKYKEKIITKFNDLSKDYGRYEKKLEDLKQQKKNNNSITDISERDKKNEQIEKDISSIEEKIKYVDVVKKDAAKYMEKEMIEFDKKNDILQGSKLHWLKATANITNQNVSLDSLNLLVGDKITNFPKLSLDFSYNFNRQKNQYLFNFQAFTKIIMGNFLDANINSEKPYLVNNNNETYVFDTSGTQIGKYDMLKRAFWTSQTGLQATFFIVKSFGFSGFTSHTFALQNLEATDYRNRYSLLAGLVFRINNQEDVNKATFRILAGVENEPYKTKALDNFMVKITLGIPFNLFTKK